MDWQAMGLFLGAIATLFVAFGLVWLVKKIVSFVIAFCDLFISRFFRMFTPSEEDDEE